MEMQKMSDQKMGQFETRDVVTSDEITFSKYGGLRKRKIYFIALFFLVAIALVAVSVTLGILVNKYDDKDNDSVSKSRQPRKSPGRKSPATHQNTSTTPRDVCTTPECVKIAYEIISKMDSSVDPCEDFYQFSCGGYLKRTVIPEDRASVGIVSELIDREGIQLKELLERPIMKNDPNYVKIVKRFYSSCYDYDLINKIGPQPLIDKINKSFGGWPLTTPKWSRNKMNLSQLISKLYLSGGISSIFKLQVETDYKNSSKNVLTIDQPSFVLPNRDYYLVAKNDSTLEVYRELIYNIGKLYGFANSTSAMNEVNEIIDFETQLAKISVPEEKRREGSALYNPTSLSIISEIYSGIVNWQYLITSIFNSPEIYDNDVTEYEVIINKSPEYFDKLNKLILNVDTKIVVNYLIWNIINGLAHTQGDQIRNLYLPLNKAVSGTSVRSPRYITCVMTANGFFPLAAGKLFVEENFGSEASKRAKTMIKNIKNALNEIFDEVNWLDKKTREMAKEKERYIRESVGYPQKLNNETYMTENHNQYNITDNNFLDNVLDVSSENVKKDIRKLHKPVDKAEPGPYYQAALVNAFYDPSKNEIMFPAGILQPPYFSSNYSHSVNYGAMGTLVGHELTHAFDDEGSQFDKDGNLARWWTNVTFQKFELKSKCIIDQYANYSVDVGGGVTMNVNGVNTQGENIADNGGLKEAFKAYRNWVVNQNSGKEEQPLPGLMKYNHNQIFFIAYGQSWCEKRRNKATIRLLRADPHAPEEFRVNGPLQNSEDFSKIFGCSDESKMNPKKKCSVW